MQHLVNAEHFFMGRRFKDVVRRRKRKPFILKNKFFAGRIDEKECVMPLFFSYFRNEHRMELHLQFPIPPLPQKLRYKNPIVLCGSCFAAGIGELLVRYKFMADVNPHGILYDPHALAHALQDYAVQRVLGKDDLFYDKGLWKSFSHHGSFSDPDPLVVLQQINARIRGAHEYLRSGRWLMITLGSAFFYRHLQGGIPVANCHKIPAGEFRKEMITKEETVEVLGRAIQHLQALNPALHVLITVSPVRYVRDGVVQNNLGKAVLLQAAHALAQQIPQCTYFPAYELVIDDLRDYRFYKEDLVHPNEMAFRYVWEKFRAAALDEATAQVYLEVQKIVQARMHRVLHPGTEASRDFLLSQVERCEALGAQALAPDLTEELDYFRGMIRRS
jgi:hypothetical protein